jgi:hypothetical protein
MKAIHTFDSQWLNVEYLMDSSAVAEPPVAIGNDAIPIIAADIDASCVGFAFSFFDDFCQLEAE